MDKKFIAAVLVCFAALTAMATGTYWIGQKSQDNVINLKEADNSVTKSNDEKVTTYGTTDSAQAAQNILGENATEGDRISDSDKKETVSSYEGETKVVSQVDVVEENTQSNASKDEKLGGLSSEAAAAIQKLKFNKKSSLAWPVQGNILLEYNMKNTVYFSTLNEYKCNPSIVIQSEEGQKVCAAADGVVTELGQDDELGVYMKVALGNDYVATYGQIINPEAEVGTAVKAGQTLAYVNKPTRYYTKEGDNLYFKLTRKDKPVDPLNFLDYED